MMSAVKNKWEDRTPKRYLTCYSNLLPVVYGRCHINQHSAAQVRGATPKWKRIQDIFYILISLPVTLPLMAALALWIEFVSPGPLLFRQKRIGLHEERFTLYKFRSMKMDASEEHHRNHFEKLVRSNRPMVKLDSLSDPRLLPGCCLVRAAGLDELPQLFNILRGEMSLVGPRPCLVDELRYFGSEQRVRFNVLPGLTGIWQVHGRGHATFNEMNAMDEYYIQHMSPKLDLGLILRTPLTLLWHVLQAPYHHRQAVSKTESVLGESALVSEDTSQQSR